MPKMKAPWTDFAGNAIYEGDTIQHPDGYSGVVTIDSDFKNEWRVLYSNGNNCALILQIGDKGQAVKTVLAHAVVEHAAPVAAQSAVAAASVQPGWKLVPIEPTPEMTAAAMTEAKFDPKLAGMFISGLIANYRKMLAAAPLHEAGNAAAVQAELSDDEISKIYTKCLQQWRRMPHIFPTMDLVFARAILAASQSPAAAPSIAAPTEVERVKALQVARAALKTADYAIKGREHTGFINNAIAVIDAAIATGEKHE